MYWYCAYEYRKPSAPPTSNPIYSNGSASSSSALHEPSIKSPNGKRARGRPRKLQAASQQVQPSTPTSTSTWIPASTQKSTLSGPSHTPNLFSSPTSPSIVICGWIDYGTESELATELWHLFLSPEDRVVCLNMAKHTWDLDHDFQMFFCTEGHLRILGTDDVEGDKQKTNRNAQSKCFNIYVDLPY